MLRFRSFFFFFLPFFYFFRFFIFGCLFLGWNRVDFTPQFQSCYDKMTLNQLSNCKATFLCVNNHLPGGACEVTETVPAGISVVDEIGDVGGI